MTIFRLKELAARGLHGAPPNVRWNYDRHELLADGVVHAIGLAAGLIATIVLIVVACLLATPADIAAVSVYAGGLIMMLAFSATYNLFPISRWKWILRRFDHSASNPPKPHWLVGTLWHRQSSVVTGVRYL